MRGTVLFIDDDTNFLSATQRILRHEPYEVISIESPKEGLSILQDKEVDVLVVDQNMPQMSGVEFLSLARELSPETLRIMLTGEADLCLAMDAINQGEIYRFFTKPYNPVDFGMMLRRAVQQKKLLGHSQRAVELLKMQASYIEHLERVHPGISQIQRDERGCVLIQGPFGDIEDIIDELEAELNAIETTLFKN